MMMMMMMMFGLKQLTLAGIANHDVVTGEFSLHT